MAKIIVSMNESTSARAVDPLIPLEKALTKANFHTVIRKPNLVTGRLSATEIGKYKYITGVHVTVEPAGQSYAAITLVPKFRATNVLRDAVTSELDLSPAKFSVRTTDPEKIIQKIFSEARKLASRLAALDEQITAAAAGRRSALKLKSGMTFDATTVAKFKADLPAELKVIEYMGVPTIQKLVKAVLKAIK